MPILIGFGLFAGRHWIKAWIDNRIAVQGEKELESYRAELRAEKEQISALRENVLSGQANRQALLDQRRIEVVARVWESVNQLASFRFSAEILQKINIEAAAELAPNDPKTREFFAALAKIARPTEKFSNPTKADEPFISPVAWAFYNAYCSIATVAFAVLSALEHGLDPNRFVKTEEMVALAKTILPHQSDFMDKYGPYGAYFLLDEIKQKLLDELHSVLEGKEADREQLQHAIEITKQARIVSDAGTKHDLGLDAQIPEAIKADATD